MPSYKSFRIAISTDMNLRFDAIWERAPDFAIALWNTVWICSLGTVLSLLLGIVLFLPLVSHQAIVRRSIQIFLECARAIPFLILVYLVYYGLPSLGVTFNEWQTAVLTMLLRWNM